MKIKEVENYKTCIVIVCPYCGGSMAGAHYINQPIQCLRSKCKKIFKIKENKKVK